MALSVLPEYNQGRCIQDSSPSRSLSKVIASFAEPLSLVAPGGGLTQLDLSLDDTDFIWDSLFSTRQDSNDSGYDTSDLAGTTSEYPSAFIRTYRSDDDM